MRTIVLLSWVLVGCFQDFGLDREVAGTTGTDADAETGAETETVVVTDADTIEDTTVRRCQTVTECAVFGVDPPGCDAGDFDYFPICTPPAESSRDCEFSGLGDPGPSDAFCDSQGTCTHFDYTPVVTCRGTERFVGALIDLRTSDAGTLWAEITRNGMTDDVTTSLTFDAVQRSNVAAFASLSGTRRFETLQGSLATMTLGERSFYGFAQFTEDLYVMADIDEAALAYIVRGEKGSDAAPINGDYRVLALTPDSKNVMRTFVGNLRFESEQLVVGPADGGDKGSCFEGSPCTRSILMATTQADGDAREILNFTSGGLTWDAPPRDFPERNWRFTLSVNANEGALVETWKGVVVSSGARAVLVRADGEGIKPGVIIIQRTANVTNDSLLGQWAILTADFPFGVAARVRLGSVTHGPLTCGSLPRTIVLGRLFDRFRSFDVVRGAIDDTEPFGDSARYGQVMEFDDDVVEHRGWGFGTTMVGWRALNPEVFPEDFRNESGVDSQANGFALWLRTQSGFVTQTEWATRCSMP